MLDFLKKQKSTNISLPKAKMVHGIEVKKVPIGKYLMAMRELEELPEQIINDLLPDKNIKNIMAMLTTLTNDDLIRIVTRLLMIAPEHLINALSLIIDVDKETIKNTLTPKELCDVVKEYWAMNDMTDFFSTVSGLIKAKLPTLLSGFKNGSQSPSPSASQSKAS